MDPFGEGEGRGGEGRQYYNVIWHCERVEGRRQEGGWERREGSEEGGGEE